MKRLLILSLLFPAVAFAGPAQRDSIAVSLASDTGAHFRASGLIPLDNHDIWRTGYVLDASGNFNDIDFNTDGFLDVSRTLDVNFTNDWHRNFRGGVTLDFGFRGGLSNSRGGEVEQDDVLGTVLPFDKVRGTMTSGHWQSREQNLGGGAHARLAIPVYEVGVFDIRLRGALGSFQSTFGNEGLLPQLASIYYGRNSTVGPNVICRTLDSKTSSAGGSFVFLGGPSGPHRLSAGLEASSERRLKGFCNTDEDAWTADPATSFGALGRYEFKPSGSPLSASVALHATDYVGEGWRFNPEFAAVWTPREGASLSATVSRHSRFCRPLEENLSVLATGKPLLGDYLTARLEEYWDALARLDWKLAKGSFELSYLHRSYVCRTFLDYDEGASISFCSLASGGRSTLDEVRASLHLAPAPRLTANFGVRYTDARESVPHQSDDIRPMTSRWSAGADARYMTARHRWVFAASASLNGPCRVWDFMKPLDASYADGWTQVYPLVGAKVTFRTRVCDIYAQGENLTGFKQPLPVIGADDPFSTAFDASCVWGPVLGRNVRLGIVFLIDKNKKK